METSWLHTSISLWSAAAGVAVAVRIERCNALEFKAREAAIRKNEEYMSRFRSITSMLALVMLLLPALCRALPLPVVSLSATRPAPAPCHESSPAVPMSPSNQKCCIVAHYPEAMLNSAQVVSAPSAAAGPLFDLFSDSQRRQNDSAYLAIVFSSPPGPIPLRI